MASTLLYTLCLSRHVPLFGKPSVRAKEQGLIGHYRDKKPYAPDPEAVREALPYRYRKAFDRSGGQFGFYADPPGKEGPCTLTLRNARGGYLNTLYAFPYDFDPGEAKAD